MFAKCASPVRKASAICEQTVDAFCVYDLAMGDVSQVASKLKELRSRAKVPVRDMATRLGMSLGGYKHYEDRYKKPYLPRDFAEDVARELAKEGVNPAFVMALAGDDADAPSEGIEENDALVPVYDVRASAGDGLIPLEYTPITQQVVFAMQYIREVIRVDPKRLAIITVSGDSMEPTLRNGDLVMLDMGRTSFDVEGVFVFRHGETIHIKRVIRSAKSGHLLAIPDNDRYPSQEYSADEIAVIGRVVWSGGLM